MMHELSIARALLDQVRRHTPTDATVRQVCVRVGALRAIDPRAMDLAWRAATVGTSLEESQLRIETIDQGDELTLVSLEVEEPGLTSGGTPCR
ncbi:MAG: hydrogenase maturation nickel metallochaperone HypA [Phycisphaeraceae bacterium]|nr:hydrogenase maturation nickel metallochaperone HypA [Phycisphaeraceae bacterium]